MQNVIQIFTSVRQAHILPSNAHKVFVNSDKKTEHPVANHFCNNNHTVEKYKVIDIERVNGDVILREVKQSF